MTALDRSPGKTPLSVKVFNGHCLVADPGDRHLPNYHSMAGIGGATFGNRFSFVVAWYTEVNFVVAFAAI